MEENKLTRPQHLVSKPVSVFNEIQIASNSALIHSCTDEDIKAVLRYIFVLIGLKKELIPTDELAKEVLINFIKSRLLNVSLAELKLSFEYAVEKRISIDVNTWGHTFSSKTIMDVWAAYSIYKREILTKNKPKGENNYQMVNSVISILKPELLDYLKQIGTTNKKPVEKQPPTEFELLQQELLKEFDDIYFKQVDELFKQGKRPDAGQRFVKYNNKMLSQTDFVHVRIAEMNEI